MDCLLQVRELTVRYRLEGDHDHQAAAGINFEIAPGEVVGLMGESGCGKTSVAMALLGLLSRDRVAISGSVTFRGQELLCAKERELRKIRGAKISMVHQEPSIAMSPVIRVGDQIREVLHAHRQWSWKHCREVTLALIARVGL